MDQNVIRPRKNINYWTDFNYPSGKTTESIYNSSLYESTKTVKSFSHKIQKRSKNSISKAVWKYIQDYCEGTSLHGLKYVGANDVTLFERIFWFLSFLSAIGFSAFFISNIYERWTYNPVIVGINPKFGDIYSIPFPAITLCNMNQARKEEALKIIKNGNEDEKWLLSDICDSGQNEIFLNETHMNHKRNWEFIKNFVLKVSQPCDDLLLQCKWRNVEIPCVNIINSALTDEGVCCTFNRVHNKYLYHNPWTIADFNITFPSDNVDWTPEGGYPENATDNTYPYKGAGAGEHLGLTLYINVAGDEYYCSSTNSVGLKIRLHSPVETPMMTDFGFFLHPRKEVRVAVRPKVDEASPTLKGIPIKQRQCFFSVEKQLYYYRTYTKMNCELECLSNYTLEICECVPYYLPKNINTVICDKKKEYCFKKAKSDMDLEKKSALQCNCLPACNEISYFQDNSLGDISKPDLRKGAARYIEPNNLIILHVFYQSTQFRSYQKNEIFGFTEFLSNSGGLLGLFLGFSFLSAVEIVYHISLRLWCVYYKKQREKTKNIVVYPFTR